MHVMARSSHFVIVGALILGLASGGCGGSNENAGDPPTLPPAESMKMDLSLFTQSGTRALPGANYGAALWRVGLLNAAIVIALAGPVLVFDAALQAKPQYKDGKWVWDLDVSQGIVKYGASLSGKVTGEDAAKQVELEMKVTSSTHTPPLDDFLWYTGTFSTSTVKGSWQFFEPKITISDKSLVRIDYEVTDEAHRKLTITNNRVDGNADAGDVIAYLRDGDIARVSVQDKSEAVTYAAQISVSTGAGYIEVPGYNDGKRACWDGSHQNVTCP